MSQQIFGIFFVIIATVTVVVLFFLYRLMISIGRLDRRLDQLTRHLRDLNLYDFAAAEVKVLAGETELESERDSAAATDTVGNSAKS